MAAQKKNLQGKKDNSQINISLSSFENFVNYLLTGLTFSLSLLFFLYLGFYFAKHVFN